MGVGVGSGLGFFLLSEEVEKSSARALIVLVKNNGVTIAKSKNNGESLRMAVTSFVAGVLQMASCDVKAEILFQRNTTSNFTCSSSAESRRDKPIPIP